MPDDFKSLTRAPDVEFQQKGIAPPEALYIGINDRLLVVVMVQLSTMEVEFFGRILLTDGGIVPFSHRVAPGSAYTAVQSTLPLPEGWLLSIAVNAAAGFPSIGQAYVAAYVARGLTASNTRFLTLFAGYFTQIFTPGWPGGRQLSSLEGPGFIRSITGTNPAAGAEISETVPAGARWRLNSISFNLVDSATAATRRPHLVIDDGVNILQRIPSEATSIAGETMRYTFAAGLNAQAFATGGTLQALPVDVHLTAGFRIRTLTDAIQVGDDYAAPQLLVEEWLNI